MKLPTFTPGQAKFCGAAILGLVTFAIVPYFIPAAVMAGLGYMLVDADLNLPGPRTF